MPDTSTPDLKSGFVKRFLLVFCVTALIMASFLVGLAAFLPQLVSTAKFKDFLESRASNIINRRVQVADLKWAWTEEIVIDNISIEDDPAFSNKPILNIKKVRLKIHWGEILRSRLHFDLFINGLETRLIRNTNGKTNAGMLLAQFKPADAKAKEQAPLNPENLAFVLPFDLQSRIHLDNILVQVDDRSQNKQAALQNASVHFDIPSVYLEPATLQALADIQIDGQKIPGAHLNILIKNLFNSKKRLQITEALIDMQAAGPGAEFVFNSNLNPFTINSRTEVDLAKLTRILNPLMPKQIASTVVSGHLKFTIQGTGNPRESLSFDSTLKGRNLTVSQGFLKDKRLGPLNFTISNKGILDPFKGRLAIDQGALVLLQKSTAVWKGVVGDLYRPAPQIDLKFRSIKLDFSELLDRSDGFIPQGIKLSHTDTQNSPALAIKNCGFSGQVPTGPGDIRISDLVLNIPAFYFIPKGFQKPLLSALETRFAFENLKSTLRDFWPAQISLNASLSADSIAVKGPKDITIKKISMPQIAVSSNAISRSKNPLLGLTASFKVYETLTAEEISIPSIITVNNMQQAMDAELELPADINARLAIKKLKLKLPSLVIENHPYGPFKTNAGLNCSFNKIELLNAEPLDADIKGLKLNLWVDDILEAHVEAGAENMAAALLKTKGKALINMAPLSQKLIARFYDKIRLSGRTRLGWDIAGRWPHSKEIAKLASLKIDFKKDLSFIERLKTDSKLQDVGVDLALSKNNHLKVNSISTGSPLSYSFESKTGKGKFAGKILIRHIEKVPLKLFQDKNYSADILVSGQHDYLDSITYSQATRLRPTNINTALDISLRGMDRIFKRHLKTPVPLWLKHINATARGSLHVSEESSLGGVVENLDLGGRLDSGLELMLTANENIKLKAWALSPEMHLELGNLFSVKNLKTNLNLKKDYRLIFTEETKTAKGKIIPLSVRVLGAEPGPVTGASTALDDENTFHAKFTGTLQNRFSTQHAIAFDSAYMGLGPLPLLIDQSAIDFDLNKGLPHSDHFRFELLGGTLIGSAAVLQKNNLFFLQVRLAFSGLNTEKIYPSAGVQDMNDSELSGQLWALIPLSSQMSTLLQEFQMDMNLSRIGTRSLERFLYALDPSESNEAIVSQRRLLRLGTPRWINVYVKDGSLSMDGEVDAQGVAVAIPSLRRLNIANITGLDRYAAYLAGLDPIVKVLNVCASNAIKISTDGKDLKLKTATYQ